ncbi:MAG: DUF2177 family protein [Vicinamibacterales bacterium]
MLDLLKPIGIGLPVFVLVDFLWIGIVANGFYKRELGDLARKAGENFDPRLAPAALLYVLVVIGLAVFVLPRARTVVEAATFGALFGLVGYGVYDLTNYATLNGFTLRMTVVDMAWGTVLCGLTAAAMTVGR